MKSEYLVIIEPTKTGFSAWTPDLEGCIATGQSEESVLHNMQEAIEFHLEGLKLEKVAIPLPRSRSKMIAVTM